MKLNYLELAFLMDIKVSDAKDIFIKEISALVPKINTKNEIETSELEKYFTNVRSLDPRYDGLNKLRFYLSQKTTCYKNHLSDKRFVRKKKFTGGETVFYKICTEEQLKYIEIVFNLHHKSIYKR
jgi:hypothetical protein